MPTPEPRRPARRDPIQNRRGPLDLSGIRSIPIRERRNLVRQEDFGTLVDPRGSIADLIRSLPSILAGIELRAAIDAVVTSHRAGRPVWAAMGGHVVKVAQGPALIDLLERGVVTGFAMNGATAIHDLELAWIGETSEDVASNIADGSFGMAEETAEAFRIAAARSAEGVGLGQALGEWIEREGLPHRDLSLLAAAARVGAPCTVHVGLGTDVVHMHPGVLDGALGEASSIDFKILAAHALDLAGGCWWNVGSAVLLPEVFLKVVNIARNLGHPLEGITAINFDMLRHYRTSVNVLSRPVARGIAITGHHELLIPLFRAGVLLALEEDR